MFVKIFLLGLFAIVINASEIDDLKKLINERIEEASNFISPTDNSIYKEKDSSHINDYGTFDFIVVGSGSSGAIIANRLAENSKWSILAIEAGTTEDNFTTIPGLYHYLSPSDKNWNYKTTRQEQACYGFEENKCPIIAGRSLGGSSATFESFYIRGNSRDFDNWAALGNPDWSYENVLPYFKKAEQSLSIPDSSYHGYEGPIPTTFPNPTCGLYKLFRDASKNDGLDEVDYNAEQQDGVSEPQLNVYNGRKASTAKLVNNDKRTNLDLTLNAFVTKLLIDNATCNGVQFNKDAEIYQAFARYDVILAGGAINTAALLLRSGIGPKDELEKHEIKIHQELNVGVNYSDHLVYPGIFLRTPIEVLDTSLDDLLDEYVNQNRGLLAKPLGVEGVSFYQYPNDDGAPFTQFSYIPQNGYKSVYPIQVLANYISEVTEQMFNVVNVNTDFGLTLHIYDIRSKGKITLKSADPFDFPDIDPAIFSDLDDLQAIEQAIQKTLFLAQAQAFMPYEIYLIGSLKPCNNFPLHSMDYWYCSMRVLCFPANHITGTTRMGNDRTKAVVDQSLRVYGIKQLRIADAGIVPVAISGPTNAVSMMIGEKAADIIKSDYD